MNKEEIMKEIEHIANCELYDTIGVKYLRLNIEKLFEENKQLKNILVELEETIKNKIKSFKEDKDYFIDEKDMYDLDNLIQKLKEEYKRYRLGGKCES